MSELKWWQKSTLKQIQILQQNKPLDIIVVTGAVLSDDVKNVTVNRKLDKRNAKPWQVEIQFFQMENKLEPTEEL